MGWKGSVDDVDGAVLSSPPPGPSAARGDAGERAQAEEERVGPADAASAAAAVLATHSRHARVGAAWVRGRAWDDTRPGRGCRSVTGITRADLWACAGTHTGETAG